MVEHFSQGQISSLVGLGAAAWGAAALLIRHQGPAMFADDLRRVGSILGATPALYFFIRFSEKLTLVSAKDRLTTASLLLAPALLLDGIAMMWFPTLYENPSLRKTNPTLAMSFSRMGAASILFGAGVTLIFGFL